ncbi:MAG: enamine deaminase RidA [Deltaproteobacteria bacterium]|jgi:enamine deaminase RidA (YjgF/YER057c/UK114 family)|nr:enamine deaminase RidA [Deltaproteobacteria bacterium]MDG2065552.1 RidA family protein [SAR324 cluster bacterium]MAF55004.1 enamine deaminase RidA [Deltaproteobacteria bacterium]MDP6211435.1 RidA family protein [SAR324 cluster bacterium]MDP6308757.1 RidA family protein [SAR324 cluster bacterium]|tara:strand:- start:659 stop:1048 length:390 start_codon:yes stop_codon:yes gene_type:complete
MKFLLPEGWKQPKGYSQAVMAEGKQIYISGQIGWDETATFQTDDFAEQAGQALRNIVSILATANGGAEHITRMTWFITDKQEYLASLKSLGQKYREEVGRHFPAMSVVEVKSLMEDRAKVEIEATAVIQ